MVLNDPRALSFTEEEQELGKFAGQAVYQPDTKLGKQYVVPKLGDSYQTLSERYGIDEDTLMRQNDYQEPQAGTALQYGGLTKDEEAYAGALGLEQAIFQDFLTYSEARDITGQRRFAPTADPSEEGVIYPEGWNPAFASWFIKQTEESGYWDAYRNMSLQIEDIMDLPTMGIGQQEIDPRYMSYHVEELEDMGYGEYPELRGPAGMPNTAFYNQSPVTGEYKALPPEAVFDELYEINGIDPNDPDMVEWFWSFADDDLLHMGEFFKAIEWPSSGYGGYGYPDYPSYGSRGRSPQRSGQYGAYLQLTSWSI